MNILGMIQKVENRYYEEHVTKDQKQLLEDLAKKQCLE